MTPEDQIKLKWQKAQLEAQIKQCFHTLKAMENALLMYGEFDHMQVDFFLLQRASKVLEHELSRYQVILIHYDVLMREMNQGLM